MRDASRYGGNAVRFEASGGGQSKDAGGAACHLLSRTSSPRTARSSRSREVADVVIVSKTRLEGEVNAATVVVDAVVMVATAAERAKAESFMIVGYE